MFTDTHCHMFKEYYENFAEIIKNMENNKINRVFNNGVDAPSNREVLSYLKQYDFMYGAIGIHPEYVNAYTEEDLKFVEEHLNDDKVIAIGEIGLDYHYVDDNHDEQIALFEKQLSLAEKLKMPVVIHSRDATKDTIDTLKKYKVTGVIHAFSGSIETANVYISMGFFLGIGGVVTFKNSKLFEVVKSIGLDYIVLETDSPYLTPHPFRGMQNSSKYIPVIAKRISEVTKQPYEEVSKITGDNAIKLFDLK